MEVVVVLAIIGMLAVMAFWGLRSTGEAEQVAVAQGQLLSDLRSLQNKALTGKVSLGVASEPGTHIATISALPTTTYLTDGVVKNFPLNVEIIAILNGGTPVSPPVFFYFYNPQKTLNFDCPSFACRQVSLSPGGPILQPLGGPVTIRIRGRAGPPRSIILEGSETQVLRIGSTP